MTFTSSMLSALLILLCIACNNGKTNSSDVAVKDIKTEESYAGDSVGLPAAMQQEQQKPGKNGDLSGIDWDKKIIKTATLQVEVKNYSKYYSTMYEIVKSMGGYIAQENQSQSDFKTENIVTIKIPVMQFNEATTLLINGTGNEKLKEKNIGSEDVTTQVVDTKSRLEAKRQVRLRYLDLLKQAKNMDEVLQVQKEINALQEEMEMAAGRMTYLNQSAAYSTINLTFYQVLNPSASSDKEPGFLLKLVNAFRNGWIFIQHLILGLTSIWPLFILIGGVWLGIKKWRVSKIKTAA